MNNGINFGCNTNKQQNIFHFKITITTDVSKSTMLMFVNSHYLSPLLLNVMRDQMSYSFHCTVIIMQIGLTEVFKLFSFFY